MICGRSKVIYVNDLESIGMQMEEGVLEECLVTGKDNCNVPYNNSRNM